MKKTTTATHYLQAGPLLRDRACAYEREVVVCEAIAIAQFKLDPDLARPPHALKRAQRRT
jgi:hypothetical protein